MPYAELLIWQGDTLRYHLPTTIAPRYGDATTAGMQPHQVPERSLLVEHRFRLHLALRGPLAEAQLSSPSHSIVQEKLPGRTEITLAMGEACLDRDFVLNMQSNVAQRDTVLLDRDLDGGHVALASFVPVLPQSNEVVPRSIKMVVDCSGSMAGDSIDQARQALSEMLSLLRPEDYWLINSICGYAEERTNRQVNDIA